MKFLRKPMVVFMMISFFSLTVCREHGHFRHFFLSTASAAESRSADHQEEARPLPVRVQTKSIHIADDYEPEILYSPETDIPRKTNWVLIGLLTLLVAGGGAAAGGGGSSSDSGGGGGGGGGAGGGGSASLAW